MEKQVRKNRPLSGKIITLGKTGSKEPTIKWKNKNKQKDSVHKSDKIDPSTISGKTVINKMCLNKN